MFGNNVISEDLTILSALQKMDEIKRKVLFFVTSENKFIGVLSVGDIQRAIIKKVPLDTDVKDILRAHITTASTEQTKDEIKSIMLEKRVESMPVIDANGFLTEVINWEDIISEKNTVPKKQINLPVVIMAGGKGMRLRPITNVIPKPLIPLGDKSMLEDIMDSFEEYGCNQFFVSVNYRADMIKYYLEEQTEKKYNFELFQEEKPLGTAGSLSLLKNKINDTFFVSNCDILVDDDYSEMLRYHRENKNELTVIAAVKNYNIAYGTISTKEDGLLDEITEKPELTFMINAGLYLLEPHLIDKLPENEFFHITDLMKQLKGEGRRVGVFPVSENSWTDVGEWKTYLEYINEKH